MSLRPRNPLNLADVISSVMTEAYASDRSSAHATVQPGDELRGAFDRATRDTAEKTKTGNVTGGGGTTITKATGSAATSGGAGTKNQIPV